jgi:YVTN family beta-propeller protein
MIVVDVPSGWTVTSVPLPGTPVSYAISPDGRTFFLCTSEVAAPTAPCRLRLLDTETWQVRAVMTLSGAWTPPITLMPHPNGSDLLISSPAMDRVLVYTGQGRLLRFQRSIQLLDKPLTIALSPDGRFLFYVGAQDRSLYSWQADNVQKRVGPTGLANSIDQPGSLTVILRDGKPYVYMTVPSMGTVIVVDGSSGQAETIAVGQRPMAVVATADGRTVFVANYLTNTVVVIDAEKNTVQDTIPVRLRPYLLVTL